jgi:hypothetical protein
MYSAEREIRKIWILMGQFDEIAFLPHSIAGRTAENSQ